MTNNHSASVARRVGYLQRKSPSMPCHVSARHQADSKVPGETRSSRKKKEKTVKIMARVRAGVSACVRGSRQAQHEPGKRERAYLHIIHGMQLSNVPLAPSLSTLNLFNMPSRFCTSCSDALSSCCRCCNSSSALVKSAMVEIGVTNRQVQKRGRTLATTS